MAFNPQKLIENLKPMNLLKACNPDPAKAGNTLLVINAMGMIFAALSNTFAAAVDKNTSAEDKKFLVPAGLVTGVANIGLYYAMTDKIIKKLKDSAIKTVEGMDPKELVQKATELAKKELAKATKPEIKSAMQNTLFNKDNTITQAAIDLYKDNTKAAGGVLGAFIGAIIGCAVLTPIIRDISAYLVQKHMKKKNPNNSTDYQFIHYIDPIHVQSGRYVHQRQPLSMKNYMTLTKGNLKI